jgi:pSer/pThr/pTyr-binding forkhead associated (FHA) protein
MGGLLIALVLEPIYQWRWVNRQMIFQQWLLSHGDTTMIPLTRLASYNGIPVSQFLSEEALEK